MSWPRVMSPTPGRSTLITSAPNQARSWVQVGPDCTWVKSRMRTPSSALPSPPQGALDGATVPGCVLAGFLAVVSASPLLLVFAIVISPPLLVHRLVLRARRVFVRVDPNIDHGRFAGLRHLLARLAQGRRDVRRLAHLGAPAAPELREDRE